MAEGLIKLLTRGVDVAQPQVRLVKVKSDFNGDSQIVG